MNGLEFKCCILHKIIVRYIKIPQVIECPDFSPSGMSDHFIPYSKYKIKTVRKISGKSEKKIRMFGNPKYRALVTLLLSVIYRQCFKAGFPKISRHGATFTLHYRRAGSMVINEDELLKTFHGDLLKTTLN
jgi:hypothetical protein